MASEDEDLYVKHPHLVNGWEISHGFQGWTIKDASGLVRGRFSTARVMATHLVVLMQGHDKLGGEPADLRKLEVDDDL